MLRDKGLDVLFFEVLDGFLLQDERYLGTTLEGVTAGIRVYFKRRLVGIAREDMLDGVGVLGGGGRKRRNVNLICNEERAVETKTECANEVSTSAFITFSWEGQVSRLFPGYYSTNVPLARNSDVPDFASVPRLLWSSSGVVPMAVSALR